MSTQEMTSTNNLRELSTTSMKSQYTLWKILGIWLVGGAPIWIFAWLVYPVLRQGLPAFDGGLLWMKLMLIGLVLDLA
jgi:hypothetical protein